jgi:hypothetical protein
VLQLYATMNVNACRSDSHTPFLIVVVLGISSGPRVSNQQQESTSLMADSVEKNLHISVIPTCATVTCHYECQCIQERFRYTISDSGCAGHQQWIRVSNQQQESTGSPASWLTVSQSPNLEISTNFIFEVQISKLHSLGTTAFVHPRTKY